MPHAHPLNQPAEEMVKPNRPRHPDAAGDSAHEKSRIVDADMKRTNCSRDEAERRYAERHARKAQKRTPDPSAF